MRRQATFLLLAIVLMTTSSCGIKPIVIPKTTPVIGSVSLKGKPAAGVLVRFHPQFSTGTTQFIPSGETGHDGRFVLSTGKPGDGAPIGDYVVTLQRNRIETDKEHSGIEKEVDEFQGRYSDPNRSQWKVTVKSGSNELKAFQIE